MLHSHKSPDCYSLHQISSNSNVASLLSAPILIALGLKSYHRIPSIHFGSLTWVLEAHPNTWSLLWGWKRFSGWILEIHQEDGSVHCRRGRGLPLSMWQFRVPSMWLCLWLLSRLAYLHNQLWDRCTTSPNPLFEWHLHLRVEMGLASRWEGNQIVAENG